jgi:hypothetical protein
MWWLPRRKGLINITNIKTSMSPSGDHPVSVTIPMKNILQIIPYDARSVGARILYPTLRIV